MVAPESGIDEPGYNYSNLNSIRAKTSAMDLAGFVFLAVPPFGKSSACQSYRDEFKLKNKVTFL